MPDLTTRIGDETVVTHPGEGRDEMAQAELHRIRVRAVLQRRRLLSRPTPWRGERASRRIPS